MRPLAKLTGGGRKALTLNLLDDDVREYIAQDGFVPSYFTSTVNPGEESVDWSYASAVSGAYKSNGIVFACILARMLPFSEARFQFQQMLGGRPGRLFGNQSLSLLENPWPNGTTGELLSRMEQDGSLAGNFYATLAGDGRRIRRLRPDWVRIVSGVRGDPKAGAFEIEAEPLGYIYHPEPGSETYDPVLISTDRMVHYSPIPDPEAQWRGMSWLTPLVREVRADTYATRHKLKFFENGATMNFVVKYGESVTPENFAKYVRLFNDAHRGVDNAYKTLHIGGGADAQVIGADLRQLDFKATQGAGETRIAAAAGVGAIIARFSEGLAGSSLNSGNYSAAKRQFADMTLRPLWRTAAASLAKPAFVSVPADARLATDTRDVEFLKEDRKDAAEILSTTAQTINALVQAGYDPDAVVDAVDAGDLTRLTGRHTGLFSVQLQPAGALAVSAP